LRKASSQIVTNVVEASSDVEVRGQVTDISVPVFTWNALNFPGFCCDIDENICNALSCIQ